MEVINDADSPIGDKTPSFREAVLFWLKLGFISFGGPAGQISIMHEFLVEKKKWISERKFLHALNYCMLLPGPEAQQLAIYTGWLLHGKKGGIVAGILFVLPAMLLLTILSIIYVKVGNFPITASLLIGLKSAVIAIIIQALIKIGKKALQSAVHYFFALAAFLAIWLFNIPYPLIVGSAIAVATIFNYFAHRNNSSLPDPIADTEREERYFIHEGGESADTSKPFPNLLKVVAVAVIIGFIPILFIAAGDTDFRFWNQLAVFFTQAALVTFGGAYAVLPYVAQVSVEKFHWLSATQMMDGLALGETTPGPLIIVLSFVGFMAGFHHFGGSLLCGVYGLLMTTLYTFLPSFVFILAGAPFIERTHNNLFLKRVLSLITAVVLGVMLNLTIYLSEHVLFRDGFANGHPHYVQIGWLIVSLLALMKYKVNMIIWIVVSLLFGALWYGII